MRFVVLALAIVAALLLLVFACGSMLPESHVATRSIHLSKSQEEVWLTVSDFAHYASWAPGVTGTQRLPNQNGHPVWIIQGRWPMTLALDEVETPRQMVQRITDPKLPFGGSWTWDLSRENGGTRIVVTEHGVIRPPLFRLLSRYVFGYDATMDAYLRALARHFGESAEPGPPPGKA